MRGQVPIALILSFGTAIGAEAPPPAQRLMDAALTGSKAYDTLTYLCDRIGPRLSGSPELEKAVAWTADAMKGYGLDKVWTEPVMVPHWVRGVETGRIVAPVEHPMAVMALGMSDPTPDGGVTAEVVEVASLEEVRALGAKAKGKIVLFNKKIFPNGGEDRGYGSAAGLRHRGASEAAKVGAVGMLIRSLATADFRLPHTGSMGYEEGVPRIPAAAIAPEDAERIHRFLAAGERVRVTFTLGCKNLPDAPSANVIGEIRGREKPEEVVVIGGHLDSWDVGCGAHDDGAGIAAVMEAMRIIRASGPAPRRTIRAILFTNEENGMRGGKDYAARHAAEMPRHVAAIESDSGGFRPLGFGVTAGPGAVEIVRKLAAPLAPIEADTVEEGGGGVDISPMKAFGVPQMGLRQDTTRYFDYHHTHADTVDKVDPHELAMNAAAMAVMAYGIAEMEGTLARVPEEKQEP